AEDAVACARDGVHERRIVADNRAGEIIDLRNDGYLAAVRLEVDILNEFTRPDAGAVDDEIKNWADIFEFFKFNVAMDLAAGIEETFREMIEIDRRIHERNLECETTFECRDGRNDRSAERDRPLRNLDRKSTRLNSSHVAISYAVFCLK